jgi:hypothetical protein
MKHKKLVVPVAAAAVAHGLCPLESGHEHVPHEKGFDFYAGSETLVMGTTTAVSGLPLIDLAKSVLPVQRPK